jgi:hypothetical protein
MRRKRFPRDEKDNPNHETHSPDLGGATVTAKATERRTPAHHREKDVVASAGRMHPPSSQCGAKVVLAHHGTSPSELDGAIDSVCGFWPT